MRDGDANVTMSVTVTNTSAARTSAPPSRNRSGRHQHCFTPGEYAAPSSPAPQDSVTTGSVPESGLELSQSQVSVLPQRSQTVVFTTVIPHAVANGQLRLRFVPQPRLVPGMLTVHVSAPGWTLTGPAQVRRSLGQTTDFTWGLSS